MEHALAGIALESFGIGRSVLKQVVRAGETDRIGPYCCQTFMRLRDEVFEIAFPAAAIIGEEHEVARAGDRDPAGEVNGADIAEETGARVQAG